MKFTQLLKTAFFSYFDFILSINTFAADSVGSLSGNLSVGGSSSNYTIPIQVFPGAAGVQPNLALTVSKNGGVAISGFSSIARCRPNLERDGFLDPVDFDANDRFCFGGQLLVAINGTYGGDGTEYRTEKNSYAKIVSYGRQGEGPAYFKVWFKNGDYYEGFWKNHKYHGLGKFISHDGVITEGLF